MSTVEPIDSTEIDLTTPLTRLSKDVKLAARKLTRQRARWLVDMYYTIQENRMRSAAQQRTSEESAEPSGLIGWVFLSMESFENAIKNALGEFAKSYRVGQWLQAQYGIGPVLSAAMLAFFDIRRARTCGHFLRFAGLDPTAKWLKADEVNKIIIEALNGSKDLSFEAAQRIAEQTKRNPNVIFHKWHEGFKTPTSELKKGAEALKWWLSTRPHNARLKSIVAYKMGECFVKFQNRDQCFYGQLFKMKKEEIARRNLEGQFAQVAKYEMEAKPKMTKTERWKHWQAGQIAPAHVHDRARRWTVTMFISHLHHVMYEDFYGELPPKPYVFEHVEGQEHEHYYSPPHWPGEYDGKSLKELLV